MNVLIDSKPWMILWIYNMLLKNSNLISMLPNYFSTFFIIVYTLVMPFIKSESTHSSMFNPLY